MASLAQLLTDLGNAVEAARAHVATFEQQHIKGLRDIATAAEDMVSVAGGAGPEGLVSELVSAALDELKTRVNAAFTRPAPPPADIVAPVPPGFDPTPAPGPF